MRDANLFIVSRTTRLALIAGLMLAACSSSDKEKQEVAKLAETCAINSNCENPLVCAFSHCHEECEADRDCAAKERCVKGKDGHICQLSTETQCTHDKDCLGDQVCGVDGECRDECKATSDCSGGQTCANSGECASTDPSKDKLDDDGNILADNSAAGGSGGSSGKSGAGGAAGGGAGKSGAGGAGGAGGKAGGGGAGGMSSDPCSAETTPNEDRDHATPFTLNTDTKLCLQNKADIDFYELKTPDSPAQGGFYTIKITEVGTTGGVRAIAQAAADNGDVEETSGSAGMSVFFWFNAKAGATFRLRVLVYTGGTDAAVPYTLRADYKGVPDDNEPNDLRGSATQMTLGTAIHGYLFAGFENSTSVAATAWDDWFKVTLVSSPVEIALTDLAADIGGSVTLYDSNGSEKDSQSESAGASVVWTPNSTYTTAGDYYLKVTKYTGGLTSSSGSTVPAYLTQPYTLTVTSK